MTASELGAGHPRTAAFRNALGVLHARSGRWSEAAAVWQGVLDGAPAARLVVVDEGVGIPPDELETVFDKFVQSSKTKSGAGGTGPPPGPR